MKPNLHGNDDAARLLVRVLGRQDAVWLPIRCSEWEHPRPAAIYHAQQAYRRNGGITIVIGGSSAERKSGERSIDRLLAAGYLKARQRKRGRLLWLADVAEDRVRQLCGLPGLWLSFETARRFNQDWVRETAFNDGKGWGDGRSQELNFVEALMLPCLIRGIVHASSTIHGHVLYQRLKASPPWPVPTEDVEPDETLTRYYYEERSTERQRIVTNPETSPTELGFVPLSLAALGG